MGTVRKCKNTIVVSKIAARLILIRPSEFTDAGIKAITKWLNSEMRLVKCSRRTLPSVHSPCYWYTVTNPVPVGRKNRLVKSKKIFGSGKIED